MKKIIVLILCVLFFSVFINNAISVKETNYNKISSVIRVSKPHFIEKGEYFAIELSNSTSYLMIENEPMLPKISKTYVFPKGTEILDISVDYSKNCYFLDKKILPTPPLEIKCSEKENNEFWNILNNSVYSSSELYPPEKYIIQTGGGINDSKRVLFLKITVIPQYNPINNLIYIPQKINIKIKFNPPNEDISFLDNYDMVIISPKIFSKTIEPLINHKNKIGIQTFLKTTEEIYDEYRGRDKPEQIKYFIKDAIEKYDIGYVLLIGGLKSIFFGNPRDDANQGSKDWYIPVRYSNYYDDTNQWFSDPGFISDLYYADVYDAYGNFSTWDSNENNIFAEWPKFNLPIDIFDCYPDICLGRLACRNIYEVETTIEKIINYETSTYSKPWFNNIVFMSGEIHPDPGTNYIEGEVVCDYIIENFLSDFNSIKLYSSYRNTNLNYIPSPENIIREISNGCGFVVFNAHGYPDCVDVFWPGEFSWDDSPGGLGCYDILDISNGDKLPIALFNGCLCGMFNISFFGSLLGKPHMWSFKYKAIPECICWFMTKSKQGGSIASLGFSGIGYGDLGEKGDLDGDGINDPDCIEKHNGYLLCQFFKIYSKGKDFLGDVMVDTINRYLDTYPAFEEKSSDKQIQAWTLFGDPSLKIGGYSHD